MRTLADYTLGLAIVLTHLMLMALQEWRRENERAARSLYPRALD